jgi:hypothetical protein
MTAICRPSCARRTAACATAGGRGTGCAPSGPAASGWPRSRRLERRLSEALGRGIADELEPAGERPDDLRSQLQDAQAQLFELQEQLADAREELDAVREINRDLLADRNRKAD